MSTYRFRRSYRGSVQAVILDWAGTAVDYGSRAPVMAFVEAFRAQGIEITIAEARKPMGLFKKDHIRVITQMPAVAERWQSSHGRLPSEADVEAIYARFVPLQIQVLTQYADPIPGVVEAVAALRERGCKIGSTTGYIREMMDVLMPEARQRGYEPDEAVCPSDVPSGRPAPWMALTNAMRLGVYPMEAVVKVGDTLPDIAEGLNAGMWSVGVAKTGNGLGLSEAEVNALPPDELAQRLASAREAMYQAGAHYVVDAVADLPALLDQIESRLAQGDHPLG